MRGSSIPFGVRFVLVALFLLAGTAFAHADDVSGSWVINSDGWKFVLKIEQKDNTIKGTITGINNDDKSTIEGKITSREITFTRSGGDQVYKSYLLGADPATKGG